MKACFQTVLLFFSTLIAFQVNAKSTSFNSLLLASESTSNRVDDFCQLFPSAVQSHNKGSSALIMLGSLSLNIQRKKDLN